MDLFPDFKDLLAAFAESGVRYVLVGGYAAIFHGRPRATKDIVLLVAVDPQNRERLAKALTAFGASQTVVDAAGALRSDEIAYFGVSPLRVDLLGSISGIDFERAFEGAVQTMLDGVPLRVLSLADLIANKRASARPRDLEDAEELERIAARSRK